MSVASMVIAAVQAAAPGWPCEQGNFEQPSDRYFTFLLTANPADFGDDEPDADIWEVQLHLFAPYTTDTTQLRRDVRNALAEAGFTYPGMTVATARLSNDDGTEQHIVFECEIATGCGNGDL